MSSITRPDGCAKGIAETRRPAAAAATRGGAAVEQKNAPHGPTFVEGFRDFRTSDRFFWCFSMTVSASLLIQSPRL
eukprot:CAMPEP_0176203126 /NCGR_PEP_ID=MMETSP0121_2-20121125/10422_1 /TAXON_ID=160619 /ORGANISM="Kryptoperidinium foliaceum, Strain CCMP 1326" /LENGTH=75 /DNA_ID=CAMNT_0017542027 /DNA_START=135 /DNA_END=359 /DNA_ORIENTATION=+